MRRAMGPTTFCDDRLQRLDVERLLRHDLLQPPVLILQLLQSLHLAQLHAAVLGFPAVVRLLGDAVRANQVGDLPPGFALADDRQDLLVGELAPFHRSSEVEHHGAKEKAPLSFGGHLLARNAIVRRLRKHATPQAHAAATIDLQLMHKVHMRQCWSECRESLQMART
jgi:hypothetical protein